MQKQNKPKKKKIFLIKMNLKSKTKQKHIETF